VDFKKHIFVVVVAVVVVVAIGLYLVFVPAVTTEADALKKQCEDKANNIGQLANRANRPDELKTQKHLDLASKYEENLKKQIAEHQTIWATRAKLDLKFDNTPTDNNKFDVWLMEQRGKIIESAGAAGLALPADIEKVMFKEPATNDTSKDATLTRAYRVRHMAIMQEVISILSTKPVKQELEIWDPKTPGAKKQFELGALALEKITIANPRTPSEKTPLLEEVNKRAGRGATAAAPKIVDLPYSVTSVDIVFTAPLSAVPAYMKALESSSRWLGAVSRVDFKRAVPPYPTPGDKRLENAGPVPGLNTYFQEGPVQVQVTLDLYEYEKGREEEFNKMLASLGEAPKPAAAAPAAAK